jgi:hypothetical protein
MWLSRIFTVGGLPSCVGLEVYPCVRLIVVGRFRIPLSPPVAFLLL